jgi:replicative DNA helicase
MLELHTKGIPIDLLSVSARLKEKEIVDQVGGMSYLTELVNGVPSSTNAKYYAEIVQKKSIMRNLIDASEFVGELGFDEAANSTNFSTRQRKKSSKLPILPVHTNSWPSATRFMKPGSASINSTTLKDQASRRSDRIF